MASLDTMKGKKPQAQDPKETMPKANDVEKLDLEIAVKFGTKLMKEAGGLDALARAVQSTEDPTQVISKFLVQLIMQIKDTIEQQGVELSPSIVLGQGGWVHQMLDLIEEELSMPRDFSERIFADVMETFKAMAQQPEQGTEQGGAAPQPEAPVAPQGGPPPAGGSGPSSQVPLNPPGGMV